MTASSLLKEWLKWIPLVRTETDVWADLIDYPAGEHEALRAATKDLITPYPNALKELRRRMGDTDLRARVEEYLQGEIPSYFRGEPVLYLCRHIASPNIQTLRFLRTAKADGMKTVIGQDPKDLFVPHNQLKRALGKLPICVGIYHKSGRTIEQFQKVSIIDFNTSNGKQINTIRTNWGQPLVEFHNELFKELASEAVQIEDDSDWVDRYNRGNLLEEYKKVLALFLVHGIMFEDYPVEASHQEAEFVTDILRPAVEFIEERFGVRPLISPLVPMGVTSTGVWEGYPPEVLEIVRKKMEV